MATHSSILAWKIPWTEESGGLQSTGSQRVGHDWVTTLSHFSIQYSLPQTCFWAKQLFFLINSVFAFEDKQKYHFLFFSFFFNTTFFSVQVRGSSWPLGTFNYSLFLEQRAALTSCQGRCDSPDGTWRRFPLLSDHSGGGCFPLGLHS